MSKKYILRIYGILAVLIVLMLLGFVYIPQHNLTVTFLDVGQGDAILIRTPLNQKILIDAGPAGKILPPLSAELGFFEKKIQLMIITHPDADHIAGFTEVLRRYEVENILLTGVQHHTHWYEEILRQIIAQEIPIIISSPERDFQFGDVLVDVFWPEENLIGNLPTDANAPSISTKVQYGDTAVVLTGDLGVEEEHEVLKKSPDLSAQILKLGHHGSRTSSSEEFITAVDPDIVIVSAGADNQFGHPHPEVLERVKNKQVLETAKEGSITLSSDGSEWRLE